MRPRASRRLFFLVPALALATTESARGNGRFPASNLVVFHPADPAHLILRTTFGHLESRDGGQSFGFVCESALRLGVEEDPMLAFTRSGPLVVATFGGLLTSDDGCRFSALPELEGEVIPDLATSAGFPDRLVAFRLRGLGGGLYQAALLRSDDAGTTFRTFPDFPVELLPLTVDLAARDPSRVYLSARRGSADDFDSALLVSNDGGESFESFPIPDTSNQRLAYIAAVDPEDSDRLYLRIDDPAGTVVLETRNAGRSFDRRFTGAGSLPGFAVAPDGRIALGGPDDGSWFGPSDALERRSDLRPTCLAFDPAGLLYACADATTGGFSFARSSDFGETFAALLDFAELCGTSTCDSESDVGALCSNDWRDVSSTLGSTCSAETPDAGPSPPPHAPDTSGCSLDARRAAGSENWLAIALGALSAASVASRARCRHRPPPRART